MTPVPGSSGSPWNIPNLLTSARFVLAIAVILLIHFNLFLAAMILFIIAASTDWMDGYWARKYGQVTKFGRIFDPFVDKIIICGTFIALVAIPDSGIQAWMAVLVVGRELLVTSLRGMIEGSGKDFSATAIGKWKMVFQCVAVVASLMFLISPAPALWLVWTLRVSVWLAVGLTIYSGYDYVMTAARMMRTSEGVAK
jgi:CDP-diacylglycerol--glycerol-3-phosphate 3-phosphatidyltransferase